MIVFVLLSSFHADLSSLIPEWGVQLSVRQQARLQAGEKLEEVASFREM